MSDYTQAFFFTKVDDVDVVEANDFEQIETEFGSVATAVNSKLDAIGDTASFASLTVTTSATFLGATIASLGTVSAGTINGSLTWSAAQDLNSQALTNVNIDSGDISAATISGSLTWSAAQDLNDQLLTNVHINSGNLAGVTVDGALTWSAAQDAITITNVDINSGAIDGTTIGAASAAAGDFTNLDYQRSTWRRVALADSPVSAAVGDLIHCTCDGPIRVLLPATHSQNDFVVVRTDEDCTQTNYVRIEPATGDSVAGQATNDTVSIKTPLLSRVVVADSSSATATNWDL